MNFQEYSIPLVLEYNKGFTSQLVAYLDEYHVFIKDEVEKLSTKGIIDKAAEVGLVKDTEEGISILTELYQHFDLGDRIKCYELLRDLMKHYNKFISQKSVCDYTNRGSKLFRIRPDFINGSYSKYDIFHIPFSFRHKVSNQRFNPPGLPCLYCSEDLETAIGEFDMQFYLYDHTDNNIGRDALNAGIFKTSRDLLTLDLSIRDFDYIYKNTDSSNYMDFMVYAAIYPLIATLHIKQDFPPAEQYISFKMEYTLPSFLMSWLFNQMGSGFRYFSGRSIDCIKYSSVKASDPTTAYNFAFPSNYSDSEDYCKNLESIFLVNYYYAYSQDLKPIIGVKQVDKSHFKIIEDLLIKKV